ncbi:MAG TPA: UvrB/UvrC motif-containing protein, partial [Terricaulis sp.]|nr:UvrB/UvrC motif-containing protein [Terricaulis sp.]
IADMERQMREAAADLEFETAARLRDDIKRLQETELLIADDPLARQSAVNAAADAAVRESRGDARATATGATVRKGKPAYRGRRRKGP